MRCDCDWSLTKNGICVIHGKTDEEKELTKLRKFLHDEYPTILEQYLKGEV